MGDYSDYLNGLAERLRRDGFKLQQAIPTPSQYKLEIVASDTKLSTFSNSWCHAILVTTSDSPSIDSVSQFSDYGWGFSMANKTRLVVGELKTAQVARVRLVAIPTVVSSSFGNDVKEWIVSTSPPHHGGDQFQFPVLLAVGEKKIYYSQKSSMFGKAYIKGVREFVQTHLGF